MSTITAVIDGTTHDVDLTKVTGLDAMQYRMETGQELDLAVLAILERGEAVLLADLVVVKWLWVRQNVDPLATFALVAATVTLFPDEKADAERLAVEVVRGVAEAREFVADAASGVQAAERGVAEARQEVAEAARDLAAAEREQRDGPTEPAPVAEG